MRPRKAAPVPRSSRPADPVSGGPTDAAGPGERARVLATALPYIRAYHDSTFVVGVDSRALEGPGAHVMLARDIALLALIGVRVVLVHGDCSGPPDPALLATRRARLHDDNRRLVRGVTCAGAAAIGLSGEDGSLFAAGRTAADIEVASTVIERVSGRDFVCVALSSTTAFGDRLCMLDAMWCASRAAQALEARKLILIAPGAAVRESDGSLVKILDVADAKCLRMPGELANAGSTMVQAAIEAIGGGVHAVHLVDAGVPGALLLEVFSPEGFGTQLQSRGRARLLAESRGYLL